MVEKFLTLSIACALLGGTGLAATGVRAEDAPEVPPPAQEEKQHRFAVGVGLWGARSPFEGAKDEPESGLFPYISYQNDWLSVDPSEAAITVFRRDYFMLQGLAAPRWLLVDPDDSPLHKDLERKIGVDLGARFSAMAGPAIASIEYRGDVSDRSNGHEVTATLGVEIGLPWDGVLGIKGGAYWRDSDLNTYLYGVLPDEVRADRPAFRIKEGFTPFAGAMVTYPVFDGVQVILAAEAEFLPDRVTDSPIIARRVVPSAFIGLFYSF